MANLTSQEKRTIRLGATVLVIFLTLTYGLRFWRALESSRTAQQAQWENVQRERRDLNRRENAVLLVQKLRANFHLDPRTLTNSTLVADASAAVQNVARTLGFQLGPIREAPARSTARELASMQLEGVGPISAALTLLHRLEGIGFPLVVDSVQITPDVQPGRLKLSLTILILDYEQWKKEAMPHA